jgi:hypothetical protein
MLPLSDPAEAQTGPTMVLVKPAIGMVPLGRDEDIMGTTSVPTCALIPDQCHAVRVSNKYG